MFTSLRISPGIRNCNEILTRPHKVQLLANLAAVYQVGYKSNSIDDMTSRSAASSPESDLRATEKTVCYVSVTQVRSETATQRQGRTHHSIRNGSRCITNLRFSPIEVYLLSIDELSNDLRICCSYSLTSSLIEPYFGQMACGCHRSGAMNTRK